MVTILVWLQVSGQLCGAEVGLTASSWALNKYSLLQAPPAPDNSTGLNFTSPRVLELPPDASVSSFVLQSTCSSGPLRVYNLTHAVEVRLPYTPVSGQSYSMPCRMWARDEFNVSCATSAVDPNATFTARLRCNGLSFTPLHYQCPPVPPTCVWWNETGLRWDTQGCTLLAEGSDNITCLCNRKSAAYQTHKATLSTRRNGKHTSPSSYRLSLLTSSCVVADLTEFAAMPFGAFFLDTLASYDRLISPEYLRRNLGVVLAVGGFYLMFIVLLALLRLKRTRQSMGYLKFVPKSR